MDIVIYPDYCDLNVRRYAMDLNELFELDGDHLKVKDHSKLKDSMDGLIYDAVFEPDEEKKKARLTLIKEACKQAGAVPASIQGLYEEMGRGYPGFTVPAINVRGLTYDTSRAIFRTAIRMDTGALIFEIARPEIGYTKQRPLEYCTVVLAAAVREGYKGPVFVQGDHFQIVRRHFSKDPDAETSYVRGLIKEALDAEFYNIDLDTSTLVDLSRPTLKEQQYPNFHNAAVLGEYIRESEPEGVTVSIGGEIGEIGGKNSDPDELKAYLDGFKEEHMAGKGLSKLSVQTGTSHGGVVLPDGTLAQVKIDFDTLGTLSEVARKDFGLSGCVQHGASTLPDEAFDMFPKTGTSEVHLATGFQNIMYDNPALPADFRNEVYEFIKKEYAGERKENQTDEQFIYKTRKKGFGPLKQKWWDLKASIKEPIERELEEKFELLFTKLKVGNTVDIVSKTVKPVLVKKKLSEAAKGLLG
jgi:fructose/tagatose bisphosphate aldolase